MHVRLTAAMVPAMLAVAFLAGGCQNPAAIQEEAASARSTVAGHPAPDFNLPDQNGNIVSLSKLRGQWIVLYFYPKDDTPGCTCEATEFTKILYQFHNMNAKVYGVSADKPALHKLFIEKFDLKLNLLSDVDHKVMTAYGAWVQAHMGGESYDRVIRSTVIIDPEGIIRYHWPEVIPTGHAERVRQRLEMLQAEAKKPSAPAKPAAATKH